MVYLSPDFPFSHARTQYWMCTSFVVDVVALYTLIYSIVRRNLERDCVIVRGRGRMWRGTIRTLDEARRRVCREATGDCCVLSPFLDSRLVTLPSLPLVSFSSMPSGAPCLVRLVIIIADR